ncbi:putative transcription factor bHLH041 [Lycium ferocissimum]|uniref:putative transcription factor bHLH041 n=1 Tax=Lycium ferocissimum TaxID=112874 RepID=UPI0028154B31|nr:putative transcription factor bHLH041 [Lycium ferocissimum]
MNNFFPENVPKQTTTTRGFPQPMSTDQNLHSSSSSSSEYSSLIFNTANTCYVTEQQETEEIQTLTQFQGLQLPKIKGEDDAITRAYLAVISSSPSSSSSSSRAQIQENFTQDHRLATRKVSAFSRFKSLGLNASIATRNCRHNMLKRSMTFFKNLYLMKRQEGIQVNPPTRTQVHHMISERRRREKINENFQQLRSLLPPGTKKDKVSVLVSTTEYLSSLKDQVEEQCKRNEMLEAQLLTKKEAYEFQQHGNGRVAVYITNIEARVVDLQVIVRGKCSMLDLVIRLLEFLKMANNVSLVSEEANTMMVHSCPVTFITLRLRIQGDEWYESAFLESAKRVVGDMT